MDRIDCHEEQIHTPAFIQNFGFLIGLNAQEKTIEFYSENLHDIVNFDEDILGKTLEYFPDLFDFILDSTHYFKIHSNLTEGFRYYGEIKQRQKTYHFTICKTGKLIFLEFEEVIKRHSSGDFFYKLIADIQQTQEENGIWNDLANSIAKIIGYDRVMVYKFLEDGSGKVVAENKNHDLESYLDLSYPESDIPRQAKALYLINRKRIFSSVHSPSVPILSKSSEAIDLTNCSLRAMSPVHAEYLKNAGVRSSFSTSIIVDNKLSGLVTCQNVMQKHLDLYDRIQAEILTVLAANEYSTLNTKQILESSIELDKKIDKLKKKLLKSDNLAESLLGSAKQLLKLVEADGVAVVYEDQIETCGKTPAKETIFQTSDWLSRNTEENVYCNRNFTQYKSEDFPIESSSAGILSAQIDPVQRKYIIWFREEISETVLWAGQKIDKKFNIKEHFGTDKLMVSPRKSFEVFAEQSRGKTPAWTKTDVHNATKIREVISELQHIQIEKIQKLNDELQKANEELDTFSYTVSHDLATPLAVMKLQAQSILRKNADTPELKTKVNSIVTEIDRMAEMMQRILQLSKIKNSEVSLTEIQMDEILKKIANEVTSVYGTEKTMIKWGELHPVLGEETLVYQVFQNIISNSVKYSSKVANPEIEISSFQKNKTVEYTIKDNGIGIPAEEMPHLFDIFRRMENAENFAGSGVGLTIVKRIMKKLDSQIEVESIEKVGTTFKLIFHRP